mgnify:CR=1 FL=1
MILDALAQLIVAESPNPAASPEVGPLGGAMGMLPLLLMFVVIYFLLIRPAGKQRKDHQNLLSSLKKDDEVVTTSGIIGRIVSLEDKLATLEIADKVKVRMLRDRIVSKTEEAKPATK